MIPNAGSLWLSPAFLHARQRPHGSRHPLKAARCAKILNEMRGATADCPKLRKFVSVGERKVGPPRSRTAAQWHASQPVSGTRQEPKPLGRPGQCVHRLCYGLGVPRARTTGCSLSRSFATETVRRRAARSHKPEKSARRPSVGFAQNPLRCTSISQGA